MEASSLTSITALTRLSSTLVALPSPTWVAKCGGKAACALRCKKISKGSIGDQTMDQRAV